MELKQAQVHHDDWLIQMHKYKDCDNQLIENGFLDKRGQSVLAANSGSNSLRINIDKCEYSVAQPYGALRKNHESARNILQQAKELKPK